MTISDIIYGQVWRTRLGEARKIISMERSYMDPKRYDVKFEVLEASSQPRSKVGEVRSIFATTFCGQAKHRVPELESEATSPCSASPSAPLIAAES